ncbi:MAG: CDP-diacylglycerol--serine O-phosphatidyltransferase [Endomicrobium sp.]|jgi:CDP-diacylglycerol--serine O-phosphatidyltransferase|nr:CDP-diacylglycerol--serine O-phosphatidyltransferase [Endomicrobium sp.]
MDNKLKKGIYIIPTLFTCGNMTCGYLSVISSINGNFTKAAWLIMLAISFDMMDGRIARLTKSTSEFGIQVDSLSDLLSFGVAPSVMMYQLILHTMGKIGLAIGVLFVLCSAFRLAKFNIKVNSNNMYYNPFMGLPTPASAGLLISFILSYELFVSDSSRYLTYKTIPIFMKNMPIFLKKIMPIVMIILSFLMVSNIPYTSFKNLKLSKPKVLKFLVLIILILSLIIVFPQNVIFVLFSMYILLGIFSYLAKFWKILVRKRLRHED